MSRITPQIWFSAAGAILLLIFLTGAPRFFYVPGAICGLMGFIRLKSEQYDVGQKPEEGGRSIFVEPPPFLPREPKQPFPSQGNMEINSLSIINPPNGARLF